MCLLVSRISGRMPPLSTPYLGGIADASNATAKNVELMQQYGQDGLDITAHSRGSDTTGNAMQILLKDNANNGVLSNTSIHYFGPADHAQDAANQLNQLSNGRQNYVELQEKRGRYPLMR